MRPGVTTVNHATNTEETREMNDEEYSELLASGWTPEDIGDLPQEENTPE